MIQLSVFQKRSSTPTLKQVIKKFNVFGKADVKANKVTLVGASLTKAMLNACSMHRGSRTTR